LPPHDLIARLRPLEIALHVGGLQVNTKLYQGVWGLARQWSINNTNKLLSNL